MTGIAGKGCMGAAQSESGYSLVIEDTVGPEIWGVALRTIPTKTGSDMVRISSVVKAAIVAAGTIGSQFGKFSFSMACRTFLGSVCAR
jgi:hypothetical protein